MDDDYCHNVIERITSRAVRTGTGCFEYREGNLKHKYGLISITINGKRKSIPAHRALYMATNNCFDLPSNVFVCHVCDNPPCVEIAHLFAGTPTENHQDMIAKGRRAKTHTPHTRHRTLTDDDVRAIRLSMEPIKLLSEKYKTSMSNISRIRNGTRKQLVS